MTEQNALALLHEVRASASWTKDIPAKFPGLPLGVRVHLEMVADLLCRVGAAPVDQAQGSDDVLPLTVRLNTTFTKAEALDVLAYTISDLAKEVISDDRFQRLGRARGMVFMLQVVGWITDDEHERLSGEIDVANAKSIRLCAAERADPAADQALPVGARLHFTLLSNSLRGAANHGELAVAAAQADGVVAGLRVGKAISEAQHDQLQARFESESQTRRAALDGLQGSLVGV